MLIRRAVGGVEGVLCLFMGLSPQHPDDDVLKAVDSIDLITVGLGLVLILLVLVRRYTRYVNHYGKFHRDNSQYDCGRLRCAERLVVQRSRVGWHANGRQLRRGVVEPCQDELPRNVRRCLGGVV